MLQLTAVDVLTLIQKRQNIIMILGVGSLVIVWLIQSRLAALTICYSELISAPLFSNVQTNNHENS